MGLSSFNDVMWHGHRHRYGQVIVTSMFNITTSSITTSLFSPGPGGQSTMYRWKRSQSRFSVIIDIRHQNELFVGSMYSSETAGNGRSNSAGKVLQLISFLIPVNFFSKSERIELSGLHIYQFSGLIHFLSVHHIFSPGLYVHHLTRRSLTVSSISSSAALSPLFKPVKISQ